jgi:hypothetical protein
MGIWEEADETFMDGILIKAIVQENDSRVF